MHLFGEINHFENPSMDYYLSAHLHVYANEADGQANHVRVTVHAAAAKRVSVFAFS